MKVCDVKSIMLRVSREDQKDIERAIALYASPLGTGELGNRAGRAIAEACRTILRAHEDTRREVRAGTDGDITVMVSNDEGTFVMTTAEELPDEIAIQYRDEERDAENEAYWKEERGEGREAY